MRNELVNKNGEISAYGFGCGYQEQHSDSEKIVRLYKEHTVYNVRVFYDLQDKRNIWFQTTNLNDARAYYKRAIKGEAGVE